MKRHSLASAFFTALIRFFSSSSPSESESSRSKKLTAVSSLVNMEQGEPLPRDENIDEPVEADHFDDRLSSRPLMTMEDRRVRGIMFGWPLRRARLSTESGAWSAGDWPSTGVNGMPWIPDGLLRRSSKDERNGEAERQWPLTGADTVGDGGREASSGGESMVQVVV